MLLQKIQYQNFGYIIWALLFPFLFLGSGCASNQAYVGRASPFVHYYDKGLGLTVKAPKVIEVEQLNQSWDFDRPYDEVWTATLDILSQYQGILAMKAEQTQGSFLVLKARDHNRTPENKKRTITYGGFYEQWMAVAVRKTSSPATTKISAAAFDPMTGRMRSNADVAQLFFSQMQIHLYSRSQWRSKFNILDQTKAAINKKDDQSDIDKKPYPYHQLEVDLGNWISRRIREELIVVSAPEIAGWLNQIVARLKAAAGSTDINTNVQIISSNALNAFALPNGDILVSSGLLDRLDTEDEIAAVLAHELDHLIQHDVINRLKVKNKGAISADIIRKTAAVGDFAVRMASAFAGVGLAGEIGIDIARNSAHLAANKGAEHLETGYVTNYSAETELRADANGISYLKKAGFRSRANVDMLNSLAMFQDKSLMKNEIVMSNLINMKPGLQERIDQLKIILKDLDPTFQEQ